jgi:hypothetical protein
MLKLDADSVIKLTVTLEKLHRSALPSAVRNTLNNAAFETKKEIPIQGAKRFITRRKTFLKAFSVVDKASGFKINSMVSMAGINSKKGADTANELEKQEFGGNLDTGRLVPHDDARISASKERRLQIKNRLNKLEAHKASKAYRSHRGTKKSKFVAAVMSTAASGKKYMLLENKGTGMLYELKSLKNRKSGRGASFKLKKVFYLKKAESANVNGRGFIRAAKTKASKSINIFYKKNAEYQLNKHWR